MNILLSEQEDINNKIGTTFFSIIVLLTIMVGLTLDHISIIIYINSFIGAIIFLILGKFEIYNKEISKYLITTYIVIFYCVVYVLLGVHNTSAPYLFFLGTAIISIYMDQKLVFYYSTLTVFLNILISLLLPTYYLLNHTITNWFYMLVIFTLHSIVCFTLTKSVAKLE